MDAVEHVGQAQAGEAHVRRPDHVDPGVHGEHAVPAAADREPFHERPRRGHLEHGAAARAVHHCARLAAQDGGALQLERAGVHTGAQHDGGGGAGGGERGGGGPGGGVDMHESRAARGEWRADQRDGDDERRGSG